MSCLFEHCIFELCPSAFLAPTTKGHLQQAEGKETSARLRTCPAPHMAQVHSLLKQKDREQFSSYQQTASRAEDVGGMPLSEQSC